MKDFAAKLKEHFSEWGIWYLWAGGLLFFIRSNWLPLVVWPPVRTDLEIVLRAAHNLLEGNAVYLSSDLWQHTKPPLTTMIFIPLDLIPIEWMRRIWDLLNVGVLFGLAYFFAKHFKATHRDAPSVSSLTILGVICVTNFWFYEIRFGQYNLITLAMIVGASRRNPYVAGLFLFLAGIIKPSNIVFLPWVLWRSKRPWSVLALSGLYCALAAGIYSYSFGWSAFLSDHVEWSEFLKRSTELYLRREVNYGLPTVLAPWNATPSLHRGLMILAVVLCWVGTRVFRNPVLVLGFASLMALTFSPMTWWANFVFLLPMSTWILGEVAIRWRHKRRVDAFILVSILTLYSGTQLIFPNYLPDFIMHNAPRLANPNWIYWIYFLLLPLLRSDLLSRKALRQASAWIKSRIE